jgi:FMN phosphatase YigB (HAD superfamily)
LAEDAGVSTDSVESVFWHYNDDVCRGEMTLDEFNTILAQRLNVLVDWKKYYLEAVEVVPGMAEVVGWVANQYKVGLLTNTMPHFIAAMQEKNLLPAVHFDSIVDSSMVHSLKPETAMYDAALKQAGVEPNEILLIDDERPNLVAAEKLGWKTMWFDGFNLDETETNIRESLQPLL